MLDFRVIPSAAIFRVAKTNPGGLVSARRQAKSLVV
jgi:hypothetical protein